MSRTLTALLTSETVKPVTAPFFLIQVDWSPVSRLSTRGTVSYGGYTWTGGTATLLALHGLAGGALEGSLSLGNTDDVVGAIALGQDLSDVAVTIWQLYGGEPYAPGSALQVFTGVIDGVELTATRAVFGLVSSGRRNLRGPRMYCQPPLCNHMPPPGTKITWGGATYVLNSNAPLLSPPAPAVTHARPDRTYRPRSR